MHGASSRKTCSDKHASRTAAKTDAAARCICAQLGEGGSPARENTASESSGRRRYAPSCSKKANPSSTRGGSNGASHRTPSSGAGRACIKRSSFAISIRRPPLLFLPVQLQTYAICRRGLLQQPRGQRALSRRAASGGVCRRSRDTVSRTSASSSRLTAVQNRLFRRPSLYSRSKKRKSASFSSSMARYASSPSRAARAKSLCTLRWGTKES